MEKFVKSRRGILQHLQERRLTTHQFAVFQLLLLLADKTTGVWWGDSVGVSSYLDMGQRAAKNALHELEEEGYIKRFRQQGSRSSHPILVDKYEITVGDLKGRRVHAGHTVDWRQPATEVRPESGPDSGRESGPEVGRDSGRESGPPYTRPQETQDLKTSNKPLLIITAPPIAPQDEKQNDRPPVDENHDDPRYDGTPKYNKPEDVPPEEQAFYLTRKLYRLLGQPKNHQSKLPEWERELGTLLGNFEFPELLKAMRWAIKEDTFWPKVIRRAESFVKNADKLMDAYCAHLRGKAAQERLPKQNAKSDKSPAMLFASQKENIHVVESVV